MTAYDPYLHVISNWPSRLDLPSTIELKEALASLSLAASLLMGMKISVWFVPAEAGAEPGHLGRIVLGRETSKVDTHELMRVDGLERDGARHLRLSWAPFLYPKEPEILVHENNVATAVSALARSRVFASMLALARASSDQPTESWVVGSLPPLNANGPLTYAMREGFDGDARSALMALQKEAELFGQVFSKVYPGLRHVACEAVRLATPAWSWSWSHVAHPPSDPPATSLGALSWREGRLPQPRWVRLGTVSLRALLGHFPVGIPSIARVPVAQIFNDGERLRLAAYQPESSELIVGQGAIPYGMTANSLVRSDDVDARQALLEILSHPVVAERLQGFAEAYAGSTPFLTRTEAEGKLPVVPASPAPVCPRCKGQPGEESACPYASEPGLVSDEPDDSPCGCCDDCRRECAEAV
jgi:hypothetical protein